MYTPTPGGVAIIIEGHHEETHQALVNTFYLQADEEHARPGRMAAALERVDTYFVQQYRLVTHYMVHFDQLVAVDISIPNGQRIDRNLGNLPGADISEALPTAMAPILKMAQHGSIGRSHKNRMFLWPIGREHLRNEPPNWWSSLYVSHVVGGFRQMRFRLGFEMHWSCVTYSHLTGEMLTLRQNDIDIGPIMGTRVARRPNHGR